MHDDSFCSTRTIKRVPWVQRVAIQTDVDSIAVQLNLPLRRLVARLAQALQLAHAKRHPITVMRLHMIDDGRRHNATDFQAETCRVGVRAAGRGAAFASAPCGKNRTKEPAYRAQPLNASCAQPISAATSIT
jgi:hypothetical protein